MNHKEISEIRKTFDIDRQNITKICGCYVGGNRDILGTWESSFWALKEEDQIRYLEIFRKCFSGHIDRQLFNVAVPEQTEANFKEVRDGGYKDPEALLHHIYGGIIDNNNYMDGNYLILCICAAYDIPGVASDGKTMEDASDDVYNHILICVCPVALSKPEMGPEEFEKPFGKLDSRWILKNPRTAILYPAFNDRSPDLTSALIYSKALNQKEKECLRLSFGIRIPCTPGEEEKIFSRIVEEVLGTEATIPAIKSITDEVWNLAEEYKDSSEKIDADRMRKIFKAAGLNEKQLARIAHVYAAEAGSGTVLSLNNIVRRGKSVINTECGSLKLEDYAMDRVLLREVEGVPYLCLELDPGNIQVNGIEMRVGSE